MTTQEEIKWKMIGYTEFECISNGYKIIVKPWIGGYWDWSISKDGQLIDRARNHSPTKNELAAKVQAERVLKTINSSN